MSLLTCREAVFGYDGEAAVSGLNFEVNEGDYLCIAGENGSGKSTLVKGLLGLLTPLSGSVTYGEGLQSGDIGYLPQQTPAQKDFPAGVYEVVLSGRLSSRGLLPFYSKKDKEIAWANMSSLGIMPLTGKCYRELSGGQQQRVLLARALCSTRRMLLLDEPVAGLDPLVTGELYSLIKHINNELGVTIVMVSHDIRSAVKYARSILHLRGGQVFFGDMQDYAASDIGKSFIGGERND
jgi:zinc transport system ATP-binding protein